MNILAYTFLVIVFLVCFIKLEIYFIHKSKERFNELKKAYIDYKEAKENIKEYMK
jgi:cbb3-type cytochrome oxidase subunit 3